MEHASLEPSGLKIMSAADCAPGTVVWAWWGRTGGAEAYVRLASNEGDKKARFLTLTGERAFWITTVLFERPLRVIPVASPPYRIELNRQAMSRSIEQVVGLLALTVDGPFVLARGSDQHGFDETYYVSLLDWTVSAYLASNADLYTSKWGLSIHAADVNLGTKPLLEFAPTA